MNSLGYPFCTVEVEAGLFAPHIASSSTHPTCASGSCKCIRWHLPLFPLSAASASYPAESFLISSTCSHQPKPSKDPRLRAQTRKPSLLLKLALNLTNSGAISWLLPQGSVSLGSSW